MYDNAEYLNVSYPSNMTQEEQLDFLTDTAKVLESLLITTLMNDATHALVSNWEVIKLSALI